MTIKSQIPFFALLFILINMPAQSAIITPASGSYLDVKAAATTAPPGSTVEIPPGTYIWTNSLVIHSITLKGSGTNTVIIDEIPNRNPVIIIDANLLPTQVSSLTIQGGVTNTSLSSWGAGSIFVGGDNNSFWRVSYVVFNKPRNKCLAAVSHCGLVDHCTFIMAQTTGVDVNDDSVGDASWGTPYLYGGIKAVYVENCFFTNTMVGTQSAATDSNSGGRLVFRNNIVYNDGFFNHGTETGTRSRSSRSYEIYNNTFIMTDNWWQDKGAVILRGGTGVIFSNQLTGYGFLGSLINYRSTDNDGGFVPWYGATGLNPWDSNSPVLLSGVYTGAATVASGANAQPLTIAGANWAINEWLGCSVYNTNTKNFGLVVSNSTDTFYFHNFRKVQFISVFRPGDRYTVARAYPQIDQIGRGSGHPLSVGWNGNSPYSTTVDSVTGTATWPQEALEPLYVWGNTRNGISANIASTYPNIKENRDFYNSAKPSYTPLAFPHPASIVLSTNRLLPPSGLSAAPPTP